jgi:hypothetical protein
VEVDDALTEIKTVLSSPERILDNQSNKYNRRTASERFVGYSVSSKSFIIIPVKKIEVGETVDGFGKMSSEARLATTVVVASSIPPGKILWRAKI